MTNNENIDNMLDRIFSIASDYDESENAMDRVSDIKILLDILRENIVVIAASDVNSDAYFLNSVKNNVFASFNRIIDNEDDARRFLGEIKGIIKAISEGAPVYAMINLLFVSYKNNSIEINVEEKTKMYA